MYKTVLVPLDGSELSEITLEHVEGVALTCELEELILLRVVEPITGEAYAEVGISMVNVERELLTQAEDYLAGR